MWCFPFPKTMVVKRSFLCTLSTASFNEVQSSGTRTELAVATAVVTGRDTGEVVFVSPAADDTDDGCTATAPTIETTNKNNMKQNQNGRRNNRKEEEIELTTVVFASVVVLI